MGLLSRRAKHEIKAIFKSRSHVPKNRPWYVPRIPSIIVMLWRTGMLSIVTIAYLGVSMIVIMGEDVFWKFNIVDNWYTNAGTNPLDLWTFVALVGWLLIMGFGSFWVLGFLD